MNRKINPGDDLWSPDLGLVHLLKVHESGAMVVLDDRGRKWLMSKDWAARCEVCLFTTEEWK